MMRAYSLNYQSTAGQPPALGHLAPHGAAVSPCVAEVEGLVIVKYSHDARSIREALDLAGIEHGLTVTTDGLEALSFFMQQRGGFAPLPRPDFIVLELELDKVGGRVVLDAIRSDPGMCSLPVVLLGGSPAEWNLSRNDVKNCRIVRKPLDLNVLAAEFKSLSSLTLP